MRVSTPHERVSDVLWTAEQLLDDLRRLGLSEAQEGLQHAVDDLRQRVREESGEE